MARLYSTLPCGEPSSAKQSFLFLYRCSCRSMHSMHSILCFRLASRRRSAPGFQSIVPSPPSLQPCPGPINTFKKMLGRWPARLFQQPSQSGEASQPPKKAETVLFRPLRPRVVSALLPPSPSLYPSSFSTQLNKAKSCSVRGH